MKSMGFLIVITLFATPLFSFAQTTNEVSQNQSYQNLINTLMERRKQDSLNVSEIQKSAVGAYLDIKVSPPNPGPNVPVQITIESYITDLYKANISWSLNGIVMSRGMGRTSFTFQNGPSGQTTHISLSIVTNTGEVVNKDFYFTPVGVTIMWEADTYTPPFYRGKALMVPEAGVRIIAVPDMADAGNPLGAGNLVYNWKKDGYSVATASGFRKNTYSFTGPKPLTNTKITLDVSALDDSAQSEMYIYLPQTRPFILFYEKDPLLGVKYDKPFDTETTLNKKEISVSAEPYFFSNERGEVPVLKYNWSVNGKDVQNYGRSITLRNDKGLEGASLISLSMRGITKTFQSTKKDLKVNFNESSASSRPIF
ncbi:MAG: hypothetical protein WAV98_03720 [Minisyncoccia bacterium]